MGNMESNPLCPPITQGDPQYTDAVTRRVTQAWEEGSVGGGVGGGGRLDFPDGGGIAYSRGIRRDNRSTGTGAGPAADWPPRLSRQPRRGNAGAGTGGADGGAGGEGGDDQPHFFPQAFRRAQPQLQQQQRQHNRRPSLTSLPMSPYSVHDVFSGGGAGAGGVGGSHHPIMPFGRSAGEGGGRDSIGGYENSMRLGYVGPETAQRVSVSRGGSAGAGGEVRSGGFEFEPADPGGGEGTDGVGFEGADGGRMVQGVDGGGLLSAVRVDGLSPSDPGAFMGSGIGGAGNQQHSQHIQWHANPHNRLQQSQELWQRFSHARLSPLQQEQNPPLRGPQGGGDAVPEANADDLASPAGSQSLRTAATGGGSGGSGSGARSISQELYPVADNGQQSLPWG